MFLASSLTIATGLKTFHSTAPAAEHIQADLVLGLRKMRLNNKLAITNGIGIYRPTCNNHRPVSPLATTGPDPASRLKGRKGSACEPGLGIKRRGRTDILESRAAIQETTE
jgi:hypothetical protein